MAHGDYCIKLHDIPPFHPSDTLCFYQVVQEYERAVVFRLGRLRSGGAKGPGLFFMMPCVDSYKKVDLRTVSFDVPPQEVSHNGERETVDQCLYVDRLELLRLYREHLTTSYRFKSQGNALSRGAQQSALERSKTIGRHVGSERGFCYTSGSNLVSITRSTIQRLTVLRALYFVDFDLGVAPCCPPHALPILPAPQA